MNFIKFLLASQLILMAYYSSAQFCTPDDRFTNAEYFSNNEIDSLINVQYGIASNWQGDSEALKMDIYFPAISIDTMASRPFILLIHGGGFLGRDKSEFTYVCNEFAKRGYVAATMNYRLGYDQTVNGDDAKASYRAQQDANAALRFVIENADTLRIDKSWLFVGGRSAGSFTAFFMTYTSQQEWNSFIPVIESTLGSLHNSGNNLTHSFTIKGLYNNWGNAILASIQPHEMIPMISFHGESDIEAPIDNGKGGFVGSRVIHNLLENHGICSDLTIDPTGGHVVYDSPSGKLFRTNRASCFFKSLFCEQCSNFYSTDSIPSHCTNKVTSIETIQGDKVSVYPNPFHDNITFTGLNGNEIYYLYDFSGRKIFKGNFIQSQHFKNLPSGPYVLRISIGTGYQKVKLIKY